MFDRNKLINGLLRACANRPISIAAIEKMVDDIEAKLQNSLDREVSSTLIGEYAMEALKEVDEVAMCVLLQSTGSSRILIPSWRN